MSLILCSPPNCKLWKLKAFDVKQLSPSTSVPSSPKRLVWVKASFCNPPDEPILKEALKEPITFLGGMFAGLLRLDLKEDPLKEWVARTVEASGITEEEIESEGVKPENEDSPQQIDIE